MIEFSIGVDDLGLGLEAVVAASAAHAIHVHDAGIHLDNVKEGGRHSSVVFCMSMTIKIIVLNIFLAKIIITSG